MSAAVPRIARASATVPTVEARVPKAVVLLSGGLDSTVTACQARADGFDVLALTVRYGQRHDRELQAAAAVARRIEAVDHVVSEVDLGLWGGSALTDHAIAVPLDRDEATMTREVPETYVPARNTVLLSLALALAEARDADAIYFGANAVDYSGYPDCRPAFVAAFEAAANLGTKRGVAGRPFRVVTPLIALTKADIVHLGVKLGAPFGLTWSCYLGEERACGRCDSCLLRLKGFREAGVRDPLPYATGPPEAPGAD